MGFSLILKLVDVWNVVSFLDVFIVMLVFLSIWVNEVEIGYSEIKYKIKVDLVII